jgi:hypothetical protein
MEYGYTNTNHIPLVGHICHQQQWNVGSLEALDLRNYRDHPNKRKHVQER